MVIVTFRYFVLLTILIGSDFLSGFFGGTLMQVSPLDHGHVSSKVIAFSQLIHPTALISPNAKLDLMLV